MFKGIHEGPIKKYAQTTPSKSEVSNFFFKLILAFEQVYFQIVVCRFFFVLNWYRLVFKAELLN
jgi:hypothetical protein